MNQPATPSSTTIERACEWQARLQAPDCSAADREAFEKWCIDDPAHIDAWLNVAALQETTLPLRDDPQLLAATRAARNTPAHRQGRWRYALPLAAAAVLLLAIGIAGWWQLQPVDAPVRHVTQVGERRDIQLDDGTRLRLDTDTVVQARYTATRRELNVERGRVDITVAHDLDRPFEVVAARGRIRDIGTRFQVSRQRDDVTVTLIEGIVGVHLDSSVASETVLDHGQRVSYRDSGLMAAAEPADLEAADGWMRGDVIVRNQRMDRLLDELNRYSSSKIRLADPALGAQTVSGVFHADDQESLLKVLEAGWGMIATRTSGTEITLTRDKR